MEIAYKILNLFKEHNINADEVLPKKIMTDYLKNLPSQEKVLFRDAWHFLVGNGFIREGHPDGPMLTRKGEDLIKQKLS